MGVGRRLLFSTLTGILTCLLVLQPILAATGSERFLDQKLQFPVRALPRVETVDFPVKDGVILRGTHFSPPRPEGVILLLHGLGANRVHYYPIAYELARKGFAVLVPSLRAHGDSGGEYNLQLMVDDVLSCLDFLETRPERPILLLGGSTGGMVGYIAASIDQRISRAVLIAAPLSFNDVVSRDRVYGNLARFHKPILLLPDPLLNLLLKIAIDSIHRAEGEGEFPLRGQAEPLPWREQPRMLFSMNLHPGGVFSARYGDLRIERGTDFIRRSLNGPSMAGTRANCPVLAVVGTGDDVTGTESVRGIERYARALPGVQLLVLPADHRKSSYLTTAVKRQVIRFFRGFSVSLDQVPQDSGDDADTFVE